MWAGEGLKRLMSCADPTLSESLGDGDWILIVGRLREVNSLTSLGYCLAYTC